jgi:hypothetical protein
MKLLNKLRQALGRRLITDAPFNILSDNLSQYYRMLYRLNEDEDEMRSRMQTVLVTHILRERLIVDPVVLLQMYVKEFKDELTIEESHMLFFYVSKGVQELINDFNGFLELAGKLDLPEDVKPIYEMYLTTNKSNLQLEDEDEYTHLQRLDEDMFIDPEDFNDNLSSEEQLEDEDIIQTLYRKANQEAKDRTKFHSVLSKMSKDELNDVVNDIIDLMSKPNK